MYVNMQNRARALQMEPPALRKTRGPRVASRSCNRRVFAYVTRQRLRGLCPAPMSALEGSLLPPALGMAGNYSDAPFASSDLLEIRHFCETVDFRLIKHRLDAARGKYISHEPNLALFYYRPRLGGDSGR